MALKMFNKLSTGIIQFLGSPVAIININYMKRKLKNEFIWPNNPFIKNNDENKKYCVCLEISPKTTVLKKNVVLFSLKDQFYLIEKIKSFKVNH